MAEAVGALLQGLAGLAVSVGLPVGWAVWRLAGAQRRAAWGSPWGMLSAALDSALGSSPGPRSPDDENLHLVRSHWGTICENSGWAQSENVTRRVAETTGSAWDGTKRTTVRNQTEKVWHHPALVEAVAGPVGPVLTVRPLAGQTLGTFAKGADAAALGLGVDGVRVRLSAKPGHVEVTIVTRDGLAGAAAPPVNAAPAPVALGSAPDLAVGVTQAGEIWGFPTREMVLVGGVPGSGKSVTINSIICQASRFPAISISMIDLKGGVEAALVESRFSAVATNYEEADSLLAELCRIMDQRLTEMRNRGVRDFRDIGFAPQHPVMMLIVDEAAELFATISSSKEDRALAANIEKNASRLVRLSRAAGFCIIMATQKPTVDAIPSQVRDQLQNRVALRCATGEQARVILGAATDEEQQLVTSIREDQRGYAVVRTPGGPTLARANFLSDDAVREEIQKHAHLSRPLEKLI